MFLTGQEIGSYTLIRRIGRGGFGEVWLAERRAKFVTTRVAVKLPLGEQVDTEAISNEVCIWEQASGHPNVLPIIEANEYDGQVVIVSEYAPDGSLSDLLKRHGVFSARHAIELIIGVLSGLEFLHSKNIVHRDLKPENILLQGQSPRLTDFGLSRVMKMTNISSTMSGTPSYMAPECFERKRNVQTDIWAVGVILYEILNGTLPFPNSDMSELYGAIVDKEPRPFNESISEAMRRVVLTALAKDPANRYKTARDMRLVLKDVLVSIDHQSLERTISNDGQFQTIRIEHRTSLKPVVGTADYDGTEAEHIETLREITAIASPPGNLTGSASTIIGREKEIAELHALLRRPDVGLVTMTGIGGTGKTTLARAAAIGLLREFPDGVFFIDLAAITNLELVGSTIAQRIGVHESGAKPIIEMLGHHLSDKRTLLLLDNFEQLTDAAPQIGELLAASPKLKVLVTSRVPLHLRAEREFAVTPLSVPSATSGMSLEDLLNCEAIKLFVERAQRSKMNFALTSENAESITEICKRLDGLPLAIELAAARVKTLSPQSILTKLEKRLKLLTGGARDLPARQQTMRGSIEWSDELLTNEERLLFHHLAVFAGGFTVEAAEGICARRQALPNGSQFLPDDFDVFECITSLVDKSLLMANEQSDGDSRFRMLEIVREYAIEFFEKSYDANLFRKSHAEYFVGLVEEAEPHLSIAPSAFWLHRLEEEHDNLRAALNWASDHNMEMAASMAAALRYFWSRQNHLIEARKWFEIVLDKGDLNLPPKVRFKLLNGNGMFAKQQGDYETARKMYEIGLAEGRTANDVQQIASSSRGLGTVAVKQGEFETARKFFEEGLAISRALDDKFMIALTLSMLGDLARFEGDSSTARTHFEAALVTSRQLDDKWFLTTTLNNLGFVAFDQGDYDSARSHFSEALKMVQQVGNKIISSYTIDGFGAIAVECGQLERGAHLAGAAENLRVSMGSEIEPAERRFRDAYLAKLKEQIDDTTASEAFERGRRLTLEQAASLCLE